jgi:subtilisin family serine protease
VVVSRRALALFALSSAAALLLVSVPLPVAAEGSPAKIDPRVAQSVNGAATTFIVTFGERADVRAAAQGRSGKARGRAVVAALKSTALHAQAAARTKMAAEHAAGHVSDFQSLWAADAMIVNGDAQAVKDLAAMPETTRLLPNTGVGLDSSRVDIAPAVAAAPSPGRDCGLEETVQWNIAAMGADQVWSDVTGAGVLVGLIDTGADFQHEAIAANYAGAGAGHQFSWFDPVNHRAVPYDDNGHGTHTTGTATGVCGIGVAPGAHWIMAKAFNSQGSGTTVALLAAMQWMLAPGDDPDRAPHLVSNSWGGTPVSEVFRPVVEDWLAAGIVPVFSNGNSGPGPETVGEPAAYPESFAVGALDYGYYEGIAVAALPGGPGPFIGVRASGPQVPGLTAPIKYVGEACAALPNPLAGAVALAVRGGCTFEAKDNIAKAAGASALIVHQNSPDPPISMAGIPAGGVPAVMVAQPDGVALRNFAEKTAAASVRLDPSTRLKSTPREVPSVAGFSSRGPSLLGVVKPDVSAPGVNVRSAQPRSLVPQGYGLLSGTSMACPHVAGTIALLLEADPELSVDEVEQIIEATSHPLARPVPNNDSGFGSIDAVSAVQSAARASGAVKRRARP